MVTNVELAKQIEELPDDEKAELRALLAPPKSDAELGRIWRTLLVVLAVIGMAALAGAVGLSFADKPADAAWAVTTGAVGALAGLLAPSPVSKD